MKAIRLFDSVINYNNQTMKKILAIFLFLTISISSFSQMQIWRVNWSDSVTVILFASTENNIKTAVLGNWSGVDSTWNMCMIHGITGLEFCKLSCLKKEPFPRQVEAKVYVQGVLTTLYFTLEALITTGIAETPITKPKVFITGDQLQLESSGTFLAEVFDIYGRLLTTVRSVDRATIDLAFQPVGIYIVRVNNSTFKILKQ